MQMLTGLGILGIGFYLSSMMELFTTHWLFSYFFDYLILIVIVLFQDDLRRALTHVGKNPFFSGASAEQEREMVDDIARAATRLAKERIGALIVIERETGLKNFIDTGSQLDCKVKSEIIYSMFVPTSPLHDGDLTSANHLTPFVSSKQKSNSCKSLPFGSNFNILPPHFFLIK